MESALQYPGPYCSMLLADMGADVLKLERPGVGDPARQFPDFFISANRNKKSLTLDLKTPAGKEIFYRLVEGYDVFTEGSRPGVAARLGIDYETLRKINPRLIYCSISGYGQDGPYRDLPGHDLNYQAMAGMLEFFKDREGKPVPPGVPLGDICAGMFATVGIMGALMARERTGEGQHVDVSMFEGLLSWMGAQLSLFTGTGRPELEVGPAYGIFETQDGKSLTLGIAYEDWFWNRLCLAIGIEEYAKIGAPERRERKKELAEKLRTIFLRKSLGEWTKILMEADLPVAPVQSLEQVMSDPHIAFRRMIQEFSLSSGETTRQMGFPVRFSDTPAGFRAPPPDLGRDTEQVLTSLGYSREELKAFKKDGAI